MADNAAARLHALLEEALRVGSPQQPIPEVWSQVLGVPVSEQGRFIKAFGDVAGLPTAIREEFERYGASADLDPTMLEQLPKIEGAFYSYGLHNHWEAFANQITQAELITLRLAANALHKASQNDGLSKEQLQALQEEVCRLKEEVFASDLPREVVDDLLQHLDAFEQAVQMYRVTGLDPIIREAEATAVASSLADSPIRDRLWIAVIALKKARGIVQGLVAITKTASALGADIQVLEQGASDLLQLTQGDDAND